MFIYQKCDAVCPLDEREPRATHWFTRLRDDICHLEKGRGEKRQSYLTNVDNERYAIDANTS